MFGAANSGAELHAQSADVWLDAAVANARPPAGATALDASVLGWLGGRLQIDDVGPFAFDAAAYGGRSAQSRGGSWFNGTLGLETTHRIGSSLAASRIELFGLDFRHPLSYSAYGFVLEPELMRRVGPVTAVLRGKLTRGHWSLMNDLPPDSSRPVPLPLNVETDGPLAVEGAALTLGRYVGPVWVEATGQAYHSRNDERDGTYAALGAATTFTIGGAGVRLGLSHWSTPVGGEIGASGSVSLELSDRVLAYAVVEKTATDPLYASPGSVTASLGMSWRMMRRSLTASVPVVEVGKAVDGGRMVHFRLPAGDAERVALTGTFTDWAPRPMDRSGDHWVLDLVLEPGLHHFVFVLDSEHWYVPDNAPGVVDDGWGRQNASLVVEQE